MPVVVAASPLARLLGLIGLRALPPGVGLLFPRCRSVHTFGMRFALDLLWLDAGGAVVRIDRGVPPGRLRRCRAARSVLELGAARHDERRDDQRDAGQHGEQRPQAEGDGRDGGERHGGRGGQRGRGEAGVLVGQRQVVDEPLRAVALAAARALAGARGDGVRAPAVRTLADRRLLLVERHTRRSSARASPAQARHDRPRAMMSGVDPKGRAP
jgi:uncharacterized membrane protein (UPF0127 family)